MENIGGLELTVSLNDNTSKPLDRIGASLDNVAKKTSSLNGEFGSFFTELHTLSKKIENKKNVLEPSGYKAALKDIRDITNAYSELSRTLDNAKKMNLHFDTTDAEKQLENLKRMMSILYDGNTMNEKNIRTIYGRGDSKNLAAWQHDIATVTTASKNAVNDDVRYSTRMYEILQGSIQKLETARDKASSKSFVYADRSAIDYEMQSIDRLIAKYKMYRDEIQKGNKINFTDSQLKLSRDKRLGNLDVAIANTRDSESAMKGLAGLDRQINAYEARLNSSLANMNRVFSDARQKGYTPMLPGRVTSSSTGIAADMGRVGKQRNEIHSLIRELETIRKNGGNISSGLQQRLNEAFASSSERARALSTALNEADKNQKKATKEAESAALTYEKIERIITGIDTKLREVASLTNKEGLTTGTAGEIRKAYQDLEKVKQDYRYIQQSQLMMNDRQIVSQAQTSLKNAEAQKKLATENANADDKRWKADEQNRKKYSSELEQQQKRVEKWYEWAKTYENRAQTTMQNLTPGIDMSRLEKARAELEVFKNELEYIKGVLGSGNKLSSKEMTDLYMRYQNTSGEYRRGRDEAMSNDKTARAIEKIKNAHNDAQNAAAQQAKAVQDLVKQYHNLSTASQKASTSMSSLKDLFYQFAPVYGIQQMVMSVIDTGGEIEKQHIALQTIIGDMQQANDLFEGLKGLALQSPFTFGDLTKDVKQLAAYNVETDQLYDTTKRLADIAAGLGVSFERIALAYGQVKARSWLDAKELRQFAYAGVPLLQSLADMYTQQNGEKVTSAQVKKMITNREVGFGDVQKVLWGMTDEGGKFYNMQLTLSETLLGRYNKLKDAWEIMLSGFAKGDSIVGGTFKKILDFITTILLNINLLTPAITALLGVFSFNKLKGLGQSLINKGETAELRQQTLLKLRQKAAEDQLAKAELNRLMIEGQITKAEAVQLGLIEEKTIATTKMGAVMTGVSSIAKGMWAAIGGWWGASITAIMSIGTRLYTMWDDAKEAGKNAADETAQRYKKLSEDLSMVDNNLGGRIQENKGVVTGYRFGVVNSEEVKKEVDEMKNMIQEMMPGLYGEIVSNIAGKSIHDQAVALRKELENIKKSVSDNDEVEDVISKSNYYSTHFFSESLKTNISDMVNDLRAFQAEAEKGGLGIAAAWKEAWTIIDLTKVEDQFDDFMEPIKKAVQKKSPELRKPFAESLKQAAHEGMTEMEKQFFDFSFDKALGFDTLPSLVANVADKAGEKIDEHIKDKLEQRKPITEAEKKDINAAITATLEEFDNRYPLMHNDIQRILNKEPFYIQIRTQMQGNEEENPLADFYTGKVKEGGKNAYAIQDRINKLLAEGSVDKAISSSASKIKELQKEIKARARKGADSSDKQNELDIERQAFAILGGKQTDIEPKKKGNQRDKVLRDFQKEAQAVEKFIALYKKYQKEYGDVIAKKRILEETKGLGLEKYDLTDTVSAQTKLYEKAQALYKANPTDERKANRDTRSEKKSEAAFDDEVKRIDDISQAYTELNDRIKQMYDTRDKLMQKYSRKTANGLTGNIGVIGKDGMPTVIGMNSNGYAAMLRMQIENALAQGGEQTKGHTVDELLSKAENGNALAEAIGKGVIANVDMGNGIKEDVDIVAAIKSLYVKIHEDEQRQLEIAQEELDKLNTLSDQRERENSSYEYSKKYIQDSKTDQNIKERLLSNLEIRHQINQFKFTGDYLQLVKSPMTMSMELAEKTAKAFKEKLNKALSEGTISAEEYSQNIEEINSSMDNVRNNKSGIESYLTGGINGLLSDKKNYYDQQSTDYARLAEEYASKAQSQTQEGNLAGAAESRQMSSNMTQFASQASKASQMMSKTQSCIAIIDTIIHGIDNTVQGIKKAMDEIAELQESMGDDSMKYSDGYTFMSAFSNASSQATSGWDSLKNGDVGGVISGVTGSITEWFTTFNKAYDAKKDKEIEIEERQVKVLKDINKRMSSYVTENLGGLYTSDGNSKILRQMALLLNQLGDVPDDMSQLSKAVKELKSSGSTYDAQYLSLVAQRELLQNVIYSEESKKNPDYDKIEEYREDIQDLQDQIDDFAKDMAASLYGVDFKSWSSNIAQSLVDAWASGTRSVKAYKEAVSDAMKSVVTNVIQQKVIGSYLEKYVDDWYKKFDEKNGIMDEELYGDIGVIFATLQGEVAKAKTIWDAYNEIAKRYGFDLSDSASSNMSSNIQSITEDTADLLASYLNAIRADVSINRAMFEDIAMNTLPSMSTDINLSLQQLRGIKASIDAMSQNVESIHDMMNDMTLGNRKMYVVMRNIA